MQRERPEAYVAPDRRRALTAGTPLPDRAAGAVLFADISGFTPLTDALVGALGPGPGAEALTQAVDRVLTGLIGCVSRYGGSVVSFAGDAFYAWFGAEDASADADAPAVRAAAVALAMQAAMPEAGTTSVPSGRVIPLGLKVVIASGMVRRFVVGEPEIGLLDTLGGEVLDRLAAIEHLAAPGEILVDAPTASAIAARASLEPVRIDERTGHAAVPVLGLQGSTHVAGATTHEADGGPDADAHTDLLPWVPAALRDRLDGTAALLADVRPGFPTFVRFTGVDLEAPTAQADLDGVVRAAQRIYRAFGGTVLGLVLGDKGAYLQGVFGAPVAHEDDAARAASAALELERLPETTAATGVSVGIAHGRLRAGAYGAPGRRTYTCNGDAVNLAARLMTSTPAGIRVSDRARRWAGDGFAWTRLPDLALKGKAEPVAAWHLDHRASGTRRHVREDAPLVGREDVLRRLVAALDAVRAGRGAVMGIAGEAGVGKSRLLVEGLGLARAQGLTVLTGECHAYGILAPYAPWRPIWRSLVGIRDGDDDATARDAVAETLRRVDAGAVDRAPLLAPVLGLALDETPLTAALEPRLRKTSLEGLLVAILRERAAATGPLVLALEDIHWMDEPSRDLLDSVARVTRDRPVLVLAAYRPGDGTAGTLGMQRLAAFDELALDRLSAAATVDLVRERLARTPDGASPSAALVDLLAERSGGNPLYVEELVGYLAAAGVDLGDTVAVAARLPETLERLVLEQIDAVAETPRQALKVASILGRSFEVEAVAGIYPDLGDEDVVADHMDTLAARGLVAPEPVPAAGGLPAIPWAFHHLLTRDVAYGGIPGTLRSALHGRAGHWLESRGPEARDWSLDTLAHHFWLGDDEAKRREYLRRAGEAAQAAYANAAALDYLGRLAARVEGPERIDAMLRLTQLHERTGAWEAAAADADVALREALALHPADPAREGWSRVAVAEIGRKTGEYERATEQLELAGAAFEAAADERGGAQVLHLQGTVAAQTGDLTVARTKYEASLEIRRRTGDLAGQGALYSNLAIVAEYSGDDEGARVMAEEALAVRERAGDPWGAGVSHNNLGALASRAGRRDEARVHLELAAAAFAHTGDTWFAASTAVLLASVERDQGDFAAAANGYADGLATFVDLDDDLAIAELLEDASILAARMASHRKAFLLLGAAATIRDTIGSPLPESGADDMASALASAKAALGEEEAARVEAEGRSLDRAAAIALVAPAG